jgi:hypothetical protein
MKSLVFFFLLIIAFVNCNSDHHDDHDDNDILPFQPNITLEFNWEAGGSYIAYGTFVTSGFNVDTGVHSSGGTPGNVFSAIDPVNKRWTFQDGSGNFWYSQNTIYAVYPAIGPQCYQISGNYSAVINAYKISANIANPITKIGPVREFAGLIADPSLCYIRNGITMQQRADGTIYQWTTAQEFGFQDVVHNVIIERLIVVASYTFPTIVRNALNATLFAPPAACATPIPSSIYCEQFYFANW